MSSTSSSSSWPWLLVLYLSCISTPSSSTSFPSPFLPISTPSMPPAQIFLVNLILLTNHLLMPPSATIFLPLNQSIAVAFPSSQDLDTVSYHIASTRHDFKDLLILDTVSSTSELHTLLLGRTVRISRSGMSILANDHEIVAPDLYFDEHLVVHGISRALDPDFFMSQSSGASRITPFPDP